MSAARPKIRLYVPKPFAAGAPLALSAGQSHYLAQVMRAREGEAVAVFNGEDGEWRAEISAVAKKQVTLELEEKIAAQKSSPDLWLAFAPVKNKTERMVEQAVELGASRIVAVFSQHSVVRSVNEEKLMIHAIEAAEQCGRHDVPPVEQRKDIAALLSAWPKDRVLLYGDESGGGESMNALLASLPRGKYAVLVGPEGGFSAGEHAMLKAAPFVRAFGMGPRILRADTAAVAALSCVQAWLGDWNEQPHFAAKG